MQSGEQDKMTEHDPKNNSKTPQKERKPKVNKLAFCAISSFLLFLCCLSMCNSRASPLSIADTGMTPLFKNTMYASREHVRLSLSPTHFSSSPFVCHISPSALRASEYAELSICLGSSPFCMYFFPSYLTLFIHLPRRRPSHVSHTLPPHTHPPSASI